MEITKERINKMKYNAAVITISDKGAKGERIDTSGPALCEILKDKGYDVVYTNSFECNGVEYPGHRDLSDVFVALNANFKGLEEYDHLIVTESLKDYVQEY